MTKYLIQFLCIGLLSLSSVCHAILDEVGDRQQKIRTYEEINQNQTQKMDTSAAPQLDVSGSILENSILEAINQENWLLLQQRLNQYRASTNPDISLITFAQANLAKLAGNHELAIAQYRLTLSYLPDFTRAKLDLADLLATEYRDNEALALFKDAIRDQELPINVRRNIDAYITSLKQRNDLTINLSLGYFYDSNINQTSAKELCKIGSNPFDPHKQLKYCQKSANKITGMGITYNATAEKNFPISNQHGIKFSSLLYGNYYADNRKYDKNLFNVGLGYYYRKPRFNVSLLPTLEYYHEGNKPQYKSFGITGTYHVNISAPWTFDFYSYFQRMKYVRKYKRATGKMLFTSASSMYFIHPNFAILGGVDYTKRQAKSAPNLAYNRYGGRAGFYYNISQNTYINGNYSKRWKHHKGYYFSFGKRKDIENIAYLSATFKGLKFAGLTPSIYAQHTYIKSNIPFLFSYRENQVGVRVDTSF